MSTPNVVTAIADLIRSILTPIDRELAERYTTKYTENRRDISEEMRKYPDHDSAKVEALMQDQVDILIKVRMEHERAQAPKPQG